MWLSIRSGFCCGTVVTRAEEPAEVKRLADIDIEVLDRLDTRDGFKATQKEGTVEQSNSCE